MKFFFKDFLKTAYNSTSTCQHDELQKLGPHAVQGPKCAIYRPIWAITGGIFVRFNCNFASRWWNFFFKDFLKTAYNSKSTCRHDEPHKLGPHAVQGPKFAIYRPTWAIMGGIFVRFTCSYGSRWRNFSLNHFLETAYNSTSNCWDD